MHALVKHITSCFGIVLLSLFFIIVGTQSIADQSVEEIIKGRKALFSKNYSTAKRVQALSSNGDFDKAISFLFAPDFSNVTSNTFLQAMGQAFFSLSLGMGSIMAYGAYMPKDQKVVSTSFTVASLDSLVAILAGLAIFPIIFAFNLEPNSGPGLVFVSMLSAFNQMEFGFLIGPLFFILLSIAALSSSISLLEGQISFK